jgi:alpha-1,2-mannosyltransferase
VRIPRFGTVTAALVLIASLAGMTVLVLSNRTLYLGQTDALVYRGAGRFVWHSGAGLYDRSFGPFHLPFTYPPFAAALFASIAWLPFGGWQLLLTAAALSSLLLVARSSLVLGGARPAPAQVLLVTGLALWLEPVAMTMFFGQINLILLALIMVDLARGPTRLRGVGIGLAAGIKLTPLIFIPYLYLTGQRRASLVAGATFAGTIAAGFVLRAHDTIRFFGGALFRPGDSPVYLLNQSLNGTLQRLVSPVDADLAQVAWLISAVLLGLVGLAAATRAHRAGAHLVAAITCGITGLLVSPISWSHHFVWAVPLIALAFCPTRAADGRPSAPGSRFGLMAATVTCLVAGMWPLPVTPSGGLSAAFGVHPAGLLRIAPHGLARELHWSAFDAVIGNLYVIAAVVWLVAVWVRYRTDLPAPPVSPDGAGIAHDGQFSVNCPCRPPTELSPTKTSNGPGVTT